MERVLYMKRLKCKKSDIGIVIGFFSAMLLENPIFILIGVAAGLLWDQAESKGKSGNRY